MQIKILENAISSREIFTRVGSQTTYSTSEAANVESSITTYIILEEIIVYTIQSFLESGDQLLVKVETIVRVVNFIAERFKRGIFSPLKFDAFAVIHLGKERSPSMWI